MSQVGLSKSKYATYCQCPKLLWLSQYRSDEATPDSQAESRMEIGIQVGELARNYFEGTVNATELYPDGSQNRTTMLKYCCLDTYAMVKVLGKLYESCDLPKSQSTSCK